MSSRSRRPLLAAVAVVAVLAGASIGWTGALSAFERATTAIRFAERGRRNPGPVAVVGIDNRTLGTSGIPPWPWPRALQARLLLDVAALHPRLIVYDIQITTHPDDDRALSAAVAAVRPVVMVTDAVGPGGATLILGGNSTLHRLGAVPAYDGLPLTGGAEVTRFTAGFNGLASVPVAVARTLGRPDALGRDRSALIDYPGPSRTVPEIPAVAVLDRQIAERRIAGRIVFIGVPATPINDLHSTDADGGSVLSGSEIFADATETELQGIPLRPAAPWLDAALLIVSGLLAPAVALATPRLAARSAASPGALAALGWLLAGAVIGQLAFDAGRVLELMPALVATLIGAAGTAAVDLRTVRRDRARLVATFSRYVPADHVAQVVERATSQEGLADLLDATVMFCDLRGYTAFAERLAPDDLLAALNAYLDQVTAAVMDQGGSVVTFLGDGVMAVFGAPLPSEHHATRALAAARAVVATVGADRVGVGLASGMVVSGTLGRGLRIEYAAIGDATNVAARVQALTRQLDHPVLLTAETRERLADPDEVQPLGMHSLRGREQRVELFAPRGL